jgi:predicted oxidoreductase
MNEEEKRSALQNRALHKYFELVAKDLRQNGITVKKLLEGGLDIMPTKDIMKEVWRKIQIAMFDKESTKDLTTREINDILDVLNKHMGENHEIFRAFPSIETLIEYQKQLEEKEKLTRYKNSIK